MCSYPEFSFWVPTAPGGGGGGAGGVGGHELIAVVVERGVGSLVPFILPPPQRNGELMAAFTSNFLLIDM